MSHQTAVQRPGASGHATLAAYARLSKLDIYDYYLGLLVVWALLVPAARWQPQTFGLLALTLIAQVVVVAAMVGFDDITGYRDGSDAANYGSDAARRRLARKPLVAGTLTEAQALRFSWTAAAAGSALWAAVVAAAPHRPVWAVVLAAACVVAAVQYSWGLKISYRGFQELFLIGLGIGWLLVPHALLTGGTTGFVLVQAVLFGSGPMLFGLYSNTNDADGDRAAGRITVATMVSVPAHRLFVAVLTGAQVALIAGATVAGVAPWWFAVVMLPLVAMRLAHLLIGFRGDILRARRIAIHAHRVTVALLVVAGLVAGATSPATSPLVAGATA